MFPYLTGVYGVVHFRSMIFVVVELVVGYLVAVLVVYLGYTRLNFDLKFAPAIVSVTYLQPMVMQPMTAVSAVAAAVVHVTLLFFARIVFVE